MNKTQTLTRFLLGAALALLVACGNQDPESSAEDKGREETRSIRNTESIGYSGDAIADKVDAALDANEQRNQRLEEAEDGY